MLLKEAARWVAAGVVIAAAVIQLAPYGRAHTNPPVRAEPSWDSPQTRELAVRACFECHSNQTVWPWYSNIAPISWLIQRDVDEGRRKTNFSEWGRTQEEARESGEKLQNGTMPPWYYPWARISPTERHDLIRGLAITVGQEQGGKKEQQGQERG